MREQIVQKLNNQGKFELNWEETVYIVENWIRNQSQHQADVFYHNFEGDFSLQVKLNKDSVFKSHI